MRLIIFLKLQLHLYLSGLGRFTAGFREGFSVQIKNPFDDHVYLMEGI